MAESLQRKWFPDGLCFGCGPANEDGLRLESFPDGDEVVARWSASPIHRAGPEVVAWRAVLSEHCSTATLAPR